MSTIKSLSYNRGLRRHLSMFKTSTNEKLNRVVKEDNSNDDSSEQLIVVESNKPLPFLVRLWNLLK